MVSSDADAETYTWFLQTVNSAIEEEARELLKDPTISTYGDTDADEMSSNATIVAEDGFAPQFAMIDHDDSERNAILAVWPGIPIRVCQFHFMQAARWIGISLFKNDKPGNEKTRLLQRALRRAQRCPTEQHWDAFYKRLQRDVERIEPERKHANWKRVSEWLKKAWFSKHWREYACDYGLPSHISRESPWITNNYAEACFKTFDRVILNSKANKR